MRTPQDVFADIWRDKARDAARQSYVAGENLRVDEAARTLSGGRRLLDVGCGAGSLAVAVGSKYAEVYGVDIAEEAVRRARENGVLASRMDLNSARLPFEDGFFDGVAMLSVLPYFYDPYDILQECRRVLHGGGEFLLSVPNMRGLGKLFKQFVLGRFPPTSAVKTGSWDGGALHYFCGKDVQELLEGNGFRVQFRKGIFCRPRLLEKLPDGLPFLSTCKAEFFSGEVFVRAVKT